MASFSKIASCAVLPLTLALAAATCVAQSTEDPGLGTVAQADTPTGTPTSSPPQCNVDGGVNAYLSALDGYLTSGRPPGWAGAWGGWGGWGPGYGSSWGGGYGPSYAGPSYASLGWGGYGYYGYSPGYAGLGSGGYYQTPYGGLPYPYGAAPPIPDAGIFIPCP
jgi:hypothetical protein